MCCILGYSYEESCYLGLLYCDFPLRSVLYPVYCLPGTVLTIISLSLFAGFGDECKIQQEVIAGTLLCVVPYRAGDVTCCWNTPQDKDGPVNLLLWERKINQVNKELLS